ncbi:hypothetical protein KC19_1G145700 [Ceratodon purpureus]|uniref:Uncharacterized protein n=1 Tax=Ceratodon purpureus TaxID=3225 RepID=A0A8T0J8H4_CERPU|nr:hypothetical protein KC19_1G145700 [Ceratodon purpureus]
MEPSQLMVIQGEIRAKLCATKSKLFQQCQRSLEVLENILESIRPICFCSLSSADSAFSPCEMHLLCAYYGVLSWFEDSMFLRFLHPC